MNTLVDVVVVGRLGLAEEIRAGRWADRTLVGEEPVRPGGRP